MFKKEYCSDSPSFLLFLPLPPPCLPLSNGLAYFLFRIAPGSRSKVKSSAQRAIRARVVETYPLLAPHIDELIPKKAQLDLIKLF